MPHFLSGSSRVLSHAHCLELANHVLGFNGWTSDIITVSTASMYSGERVRVQVTHCLSASAEEAHQRRRRRGGGGGRGRAEEAEVRLRAAAPLPSSRTDEQRSCGAGGLLHLHR